MGAQNNGAAPPQQEAAAQNYLKSRERGWASRVDAAIERKAKPKKRKPQVSRYTKVAKQLEEAESNWNVQMVDIDPDVKFEDSFNTVDLFGGCGGLTLGFDMAGFKPLLGVEMDPDAAATYRRNFPGAFVWDQMIEDLTDEQILAIVGDRTVHVLLAGFPCQGFSIAGQRNPKDERNILFRQVVRVAKLLNPWYIVMENVPGVYTMSNGAVFKAILDEFAEIGYPDMSCRVLEAADFKVAQFRPRAIFVANRFGMANPYPRAIVSPKEYTPIEAAISDLPANARDYSINHDWTHHSPQMEERISKVEPGGSLYDSYADAWKRQYRGVPSMTVKANNGAPHIHYELNRTLSAREMARLQSFPDSFIFEGRMKRVMFQIGNAVPPLLAKSVAHAVRPSLANIADGTPRPNPNHKIRQERLVS